jgi:hypothetical protein
MQGISYCIWHDIFISNKTNNIDGVIVIVLSSVMSPLRMGTLDSCPWTHEHKDPCLSMYVVFGMFFNV